MGADQNYDWQIAAASALEWWRDAGVDMLADEVPRDWTAAPAPVVRETTRAAVAAAAAPVPARLPDTLDAFLAWRHGPDAPEAGWSGRPIAASGNPAAAIMVLTDVPDRDDAESGALLSGAAGRLFDRMLAAIGLDRDTIYLASLCAIRPVAGRIAPEVETRLAEIARHHVSLAAPKRLLILGNATSRAVLGADSLKMRGGLQTLHLETAGSATTIDVSAIATYHPRLLLERPAEKARAWKDLQMLVAGLGA